MLLDTRPTPAESQRRQIRLAAARAAFQDLDMADRIALAVELPHGALLGAMAEHHLRGDYHTVGVGLLGVAAQLRRAHAARLADLARRGIELAPEEVPLIDTRPQSPVRQPSPLRRVLAALVVAFGGGAS